MLDLVNVLLVLLQLGRYLHLILLRVALKNRRGLGHGFRIEAGLVEVVRGRLLNLYLLLLLKLSRVSEGLNWLLSLELTRNAESRLRWVHT